MRRFKPIHGIVLVVLFAGAILASELALEGRFGGSGFERVAPGSDGTVRIDAAGIEPRQIRFYRFLNTSNQEVKFFVGRDAEGHVQVAFDANEVCAKAKRGYRPEGDWLVCNKCDKSFRLAEVNAGGGGCKPVPLEHRVQGEQVVIAEADVLQGWRLFR
jgi:uncharacterized membrane protein